MKIALQLLLLILTAIAELWFIAELRDIKVKLSYLLGLVSMVLLMILIQIKW